ncbi:MAG: hypothetical protein M3R36_14470 [Bacteroidota bacterium]|nr:hypothetical protein [Bacteroidota bacterium]
MKKFVIVLCFVISFLQNGASASPRISFDELMIQSELNPQIVFLARAEAVRQGKPVNIMTTHNIMYDVKAIEDGKLVYSVFTNFADIYNGGYVIYYEDILLNESGGKLKFDFGNGRIVDNTDGYFNPIKSQNRGLISRYVMAVESSNDKAYLFDRQTGDLVDNAFIPTTQPQLILPKHAMQNYIGNNILISDQTADVVQSFDTSGTYLGVFAPAGGVNTAILDNIRGIGYRPNDNLLVTVGGGGSNNTIQQFDLSGNSLGTFIGTNLNSPFAILKRSDDYLISNSSGTNRITEFSNNGNFASNFYTGSNFAFPQQMIQLDNGNIVVAAFSSPSGLAILDEDGVYQTILNGVTGNRGVYLLGNGNYLTTNGAGIHEINPITGALIRSIVTGPSFQYLSEYNTEVLNLSLTINLEACTIGDTIDVELRSAVSPFEVIETSQRKVTPNVASSFYYTIPDNGTPYYIVVRHRNSIETWSKLTQTFTANALSYDFTTDDTQAFGDNMANIGAGEWAFYSGDVNQDGVVDLSDLALIDNDASNFVTGYVVTDLNCDETVDITDAAFADNNGLNFVAVAKP